MGCVKIFRFLWKNFQISPEKFSDFSGKIFRFLLKNFQISAEKFSDFSRKYFRFLLKNFQICLENFSDLSGKNFQICLGKFSDLSGKIFRSVREDNDYNKKEEKERRWELVSLSKHSQMYFSRSFLQYF